MASTNRSELYTVEDLRHTQNIDEYIMIFEDLIYNCQTLTPSDAFHTFKHGYCMSNYGYCNNKSIIKIIVEQNRLDTIQRLFENKINIFDKHSSSKFEHKCVINSILWGRNIEFINLIIDNNWIPNLDECRILFISNEHNTIIHLVDKFNDNDKIIKIILGLAINNSDYDVMTKILDNCSGENLDDCICENLSFRNIDKDLTEYLNKYGFDINIHKDKIFSKMLSEKKIAFGIMFMLSLGLNLDDPVYDEYK